MGLIYLYIPNRAWIYNYIFLSQCLITSARTVHISMELRVAAEDRDEEGERPLILSRFDASVGRREGGREGGREGRREEGREGRGKEGKKTKRGGGGGGRGRSSEQVGMNTSMWSTAIQLYIILSL